MPMLKYQLRQPEAGVSWPCPEDMHPILHRMLMARGVGSEEEARRFLKPGRDMFHDPFLLSDMGEAVSIIRDAIAKRERICVYGDYDVDGVCASAILTLYLRDKGASCDVYLPSRHTEGYGLNADAVDHIAEKFELLITVDCGITAFELVERAKARHLRVIVTDHHRPDDRLPDCPTVNPLLADYPFGYLCGAGVAFQLVAALENRDKAMEYIDLAALATIADIVPLRDENRAIASLGLKRINLSARPGIRALISVTGLEGREISAGNVAFQLTPRMNASGRMGDAKRAYDLVTSTDMSLCESLAQELDEENRRRRELENAALEEAEKQLEDFDFSAHAVIIVKGDEWNPGVIGLAASRLTEKYHFPSVALTRDGDYYTGSCRSIEGVNIHEALTHTAQLLERFGGHEMAAGLKVHRDRLPAFRRTLDEYLLSACDRELWIPTAEYDALAEGRDLTVELVEQVDRLAPTGCGNPAAVFLTAGSVSEAYPVGREKEHLKLTLLTQDEKRLPAIWFRHAQDINTLPRRLDVLYAPSINEYMGVKTVQAEVKQILARMPDPSAATDGKRFSAYCLEAMAAFEPDSQPEEASPEEVRAAFESNCMGSLVICSGAESAGAVMSLIGGKADFFTGEYPSDTRCFNAVCECPLGARPAKYKNVFYAGVPGCLAAGGKTLKSVPASLLFSQVPDVDSLRNVFKAARALALRKGVYPGAGEACLALAEEAGLKPEEAALGLGVLRHMGLASAEKTEDGCMLSFATERKNPAEDELFIALRS